MEDLHISFDEARRAFREQFAGRLTFLEGADFDLDVNLALVRDKRTGENVALVGSPRETIRRFLADLAEREKRGAIFKLDRWIGPGASGSLLDRFSGVSLTPGEKDLLQFLDRLARSKELQFEFEQRVARIEEKKRQLEWSGYREILEVPDFGLISYPSHSSHRSVPGSDAPEDVAFANHDPNTPGAFLFANSLFSRSYALIPKTDVRFMDSWYRDLISDLGYPPFEISAVQRSVCHGGSARCLLEGMP